MSYMRILGFVAMVAVLGAGLTPVAAAEKGKVPKISVTGAVLHADMPKAEICLTFSEAVSIKDRARAAASLDVKKNGKKVKLAPEQISFSDTDLCVQGLDHRATYDVALSRLDFASGERLVAPFTAAVTINDRKPELTFVEDHRALVLPRHVKATDKKENEAGLSMRGMAHVVRSVNVLATHLSLYRVSDRSSFAGAWQQFRMINIAPSESLYFAKNKGQLVFESDLVFGDAPNEDQTLVAPLPDEAGLTPGLYYLAAAPRGKAGLDVALFAGQWFLVSDLHIAASQQAGGFKVFASVGGKEPSVSPDAAIVVLGADGKELAEAKTGNDGSAFLSLREEDMKKAAFVVGQLASGDTDILEIKPQEAEVTPDLSFKAVITTDREIYRPGMAAAIILRAQDQKGQVMDVGESVVKLLYADRRLYSEQVLKADKAGLYQTDIVLPASRKAGGWIIAWDKKDGTRLAETPVRIAPDGMMGKLSMEADRVILSSDAPLTLNVRARDDEGKPLAYKSGQIVLTSAQPQIEGWSKYAFGDLTADKGTQGKKIPFMTDETGTARLSVSLAEIMEKLPARLQGVSFEASLETGAKAAPVIVPVRVREALIGIRSLPDGGPFSENTQAAFSVVALDMAGKSRNEPNLYYVVYEEGRSFEWVPAEGHWDYKPLPQHRRVGGGRIDVASGADSVVRWPVTTGQYLLEITNVNGDVLARYPFAVGRGAQAAQVKRETRLKLAVPESPLELKQENKLKLSLTDPAMVNVIVSDGKIRQTIHRFMKAGANEISILPADGWGYRLFVRAEAIFAGSHESEVVTQLLDVHAPAQDLAIKVASPSAVTSTTLSIPVQISKQAAGAKTYAMALVTPRGETEGTAQPAPLHSEKVLVDGDGKADVKITMPRFAGTLGVTVYAWNEMQKGMSTLSVPMQPPVMVSAMVPSALRIGDKVTIPFTISATNQTTASYAYEISVPEGFAVNGKLKDTVQLKKGGKATLVLTLVAKEPTDGALRFDIKPAAGEAVSQSWPLYVRVEQAKAWDVQTQILAPEQSVSLPFEADKKKAKLALVAPLPLPDISVALQNLVLAEPRSTQEIGLWLEAMQGWKHVAADLGLLSKERYETLRAARLLEIQKRQNEDGGFSAFGGDEVSDLLSTSAALRVLAGASGRPFELGVNWLASRLQNTWFDEKERAMRAVAFETMAKVKRVDLSSLRYFAETSRDKDLNAASAALIALALVEAGDEKAAQDWMGKAKQSDLKGVESWALLRSLAQNDKVTFDDLKKQLAEADLEAFDQIFEGYAYALHALEVAAGRAGSWQMSVDAVGDKRFGILSLPLKEGVATTLKNNAPFGLFVAQLSPAAEKKKQAKGESISLQRAVYSLSGEKIEDGASLALGRTYILYVKGGATKSPLRLGIPYSSSFTFAVPMSGDAAALEAMYAWVPSPMGDLQNAAATTTGFGFDVDVSKEWGAAFLMKPSFKGEFSIPLFRARNTDGLVSANQNALRFSVE